MNKTKQKILKTALELFNNEGVNNVTLRQIAQEIGISQGNLNYHYKTRQDIIEALYFELVQKMDELMEHSASQLPTLETLYINGVKSMEGLYNYRFILKDALHVIKESEKIKIHYIQLQKVREQQYLHIFKLLVDEGIMRKEEFPNEYSNLYHRMNILGDNWINSQELLNPDLKNPVEYYSRILFEMIYPYLTSQGKTEFIGWYNAM